MISGATQGSGGMALGNHLASFAHNEDVTLLQSRGLFSDNIKDQIDELTCMGSHARTRTPIYHLHVDPPKDKPFSPEEFQKYKDLIDKEFRLEDRPFCAVKHSKPDGSEHFHIAYLAIEPTGKAIRFNHVRWTPLSGQETGRLKRESRRFQRPSRSGGVIQT
jgi:hypothetical protein